MIREVIAFRRNGDGKTQSLDLSCGHTNVLSGAEIDRLAERAARAALDRDTLTTDCKTCDETKPEKFPKMKPIPMSAAKRIAEEYGYDQVLIYGRRCHDSPEPHGEHMATYGRTKEHCSVAALMGDTLQRLMGWQTAKEQWVERTAAEDYAASAHSGRVSWADLPDEAKEEWRAPLRADWEAD